MPSLKDLHELLKGKLHTVFALAAGILLVWFLGYKGVDFALDTNPLQISPLFVWFIKVSVAVSLSLTIFIIWLVYRKYPKRTVDKVGILIAVREDTEESRRVRKEVTEHLNEILKATSSGKEIEIVSLQDFHALKVIDDETATKASNKTNCQFVIYGKLLNFGSDFEFRLHFVVRHSPLQPNEQKHVKQGFAEALVNKNWRFIQSDAINGINVTADNIREISLYVMGIAAHLSHDCEIAKKLHEDLLQIFKTDRLKRQTLTPVYARLPLWLSDSYTILAWISYYKNNDGNTAYSLNEKALSFNQANEAALTNKALYAFELGNVGTAEQAIKQLKRKNRIQNLRDSGWRYSEAFLSFNKEKFEQGLRAYKKANNGYVPEFVTEGVISFCRNYVTKHPDKLQFHFAIAHVSIRKLSNYSLALDPLETFITKAVNDPKYAPLMEIAKKDLQDTYAILQTQSSDQIKI